MYVLTGIHGSHVLVGAIGLMAILILASSTSMYKGSTGPLQSGSIGSTIYSIYIVVPIGLLAGPAHIAVMLCGLVRLRKYMGPSHIAPGPHIEVRVLYIPVLNR